MLHLASIFNVQRMYTDVGPFVCLQVCRSVCLSVCLTLSILKSLLLLPAGNEGMDACITPRTPLWKPSSPLLHSVLS